MSKVSNLATTLLIPLTVAVSIALFASSCVKMAQNSGADSSMQADETTQSGNPAPEVADPKGETGEMQKAMQEEKARDVDEQKDIALQAARDHEALFAENRYPSAATCGTCHPKHYKEWSVSSHAYAQLSPVYMSLNSEINELTSGSDGDFCLRCHSPVGANLGESPFISNLQRHPTSREGITCIACHRMNKNYNKRSGRLALQEGNLMAPIYGPTGNEELARVLENADEYRVVTEDGKLGRKIHREVKKFASMSDPIFCGTCHDVTLLNGFRLEEAFSEYRLSPAAKKGVTCQDCHMGKVEGIPSGYEEGPAAVIGGKPTRRRKITSHFFAGPDYSIVHPGIFPHNAEAQEMASMEEWLQFDHKAGWGADEFEDNVAEDAPFPLRWESVDDRYDAREILDYQFERLEWARKRRLQVLRNGYFLGDVVTQRADVDGIRFKVKVQNLTDGHNVPTGFTGERLVWLHVVVTDGSGKVVFESGDLDPNGDVRDHESAYVHSGDVPLDTQLFDLRSRFVVQNIRGTERERIIPIPYPVITIPFVRPSIQSLVFTGEPATERVHRKGIEPLGFRWAKYKVKGKHLTGKGAYKALIELKAAMAPANLIGAIQGRGFDYGMSAREVVDGVAAGHEILYKKEITFEVTE
jgi:cytochrome c554/c'-like protein